MTKTELKILLHFLDELGAHQGNAGCNDFNLAKFMPDPIDRHILMSQYHLRNGDPEEYNPDYSYKNVSDFIVLNCLKFKLMEENGI